MVVDHFILCVVVSNVGLYLWSMWARIFQLSYKIQKIIHS
jgi:hypothetical protein